MKNLSSFYKFILSAIVIITISYLFLSLCNYSFSLKDWNGFSRFIFGLEGLIILIKSTDEI